MNYLLKIFGLINCIIYKIIYFKKLEVKLPSLFFSLNPLSFINEGKIFIGKKSIIGKYSNLIASGELIIGSNVCINAYSRIVALEKIKIGNNVTIANFVAILDHDHDYYFENNRMILKGYNTKPIIIGNNVWIGDKVTVCKGVQIGDNVIIGANSVVTRDIESNTIVGGVPAKFLKKLHV